MVVLHYTAMDSARRACDWLCNGASQVSSHYLVGRNGRITQMVREADRAWHAGAGRWGAVSDVNSRSIGIEISNDGASPFPAAQMDALEHLLAGIMHRWSIPPERVIGHSCLAPGRKIDPGPRFDWQRLARRGLAIWPSPREEGPDGTDEAAFRDLAARAGFTADVDHATLLAAVRLRFRPWGQGALSGGDMATLSDIAARFPVDAGRGEA
ncbi:N-acetylmuramoyl-L-alanine amidase [Oceaniglobus trochenteri]|uniref:N-acetylmuramoyl-L-alanine amidase n=1 Tax=Oceaniglobus trochenteri TaxID=2763260 RepID=UPI001CFF71B0|nr:N-acetylmuramoyl-L-alanine amidase [Oceaniglobus trochenteri]